MIDDEFLNQYLSDPLCDPEMRCLHELASEYHRRCEAFDKTACTGIRSGVAIPSNREEAGAINRHALSVLNEIIEKGIREGLEISMIKRAIASLWT